MVRVQGGFNDTQFGFRPGKTTIDGIETIIRIVKETKNKGEYWAVIALDNAWWPRIFWELERGECLSNL